MSLEVGLRKPDVVLVRYGELALKRGNRRDFERALCRNIEHALRGICPARVERPHGRLMVVPERRPRDAAKRLQDVFGIKSISPAWTVASDLDAITSLAHAVLEEALSAYPPERRVSFRVRARRGDKRFPLTSVELDRYVADRIVPGPERIEIRLRHPELELGIDVREKGTFVYTERLPGPGGLPVGTLGRTLCLLSGGIDSPVAAWLAMKRGCEVGFVSFYSYPYIGEASRKKVLDLARTLGRYQRNTRVHVVPFTEIQTTIRDSAPEPYRTVLYRRMMQRIASRICCERDYQALVTGESIGQVASQTLENMSCIEAAAELPVLRPLVTFDKEETIEIARRIGTLETSNRPEPDCCTVFQPARPIIRGKLEACERAEAEMDVAGLVDRAIGGLDAITIEETT